MLGGASLLMNVQTDGAIKMYRTLLNGDGCKKIKKCFSIVLCEHRVFLD